MNTRLQIKALWREMREAIDQAYAKANEAQDENGVCLRDYAENITWSDSLATLLERESANERQHRNNNRPSIPGFSVETAAKLLLMEQVRNGAELKEIPPATAFLVFRQTAVEAQVIGFLIRHHVTKQWAETVQALDYSKLMRGEQS